MPWRIPLADECVGACGLGSPFRFRGEAKGDDLWLAGELAQRAHEVLQRPIVQVPVDEHDIGAGGLCAGQCLPSIRCISDHAQLWPGLQQPRKGPSCHSPPASDQDSHALLSILCTSSDASITMPSDPIVHEKLSPCPRQRESERLNRG